MKNIMHFSKSQLLHISCVLINRGIIVSFPHAAFISSSRLRPPQKKTSTHCHDDLQARLFLTFPSGTQFLWKSKLAAYSSDWLIKILAAVLLLCLCMAKYLF